MIWNPLLILRGEVADNRALMRDRAVRWARAFREDPRLRADLIELGEVLAQFPHLYDNGTRVPDAMNGERLAYERGRTDMALAILAMGGLTDYELSNLMEDPHGH